MDHTDESMEVSSATSTFKSSQSIRRISSSTDTISKSNSLKRKENSSGHLLIQKRYRDKINSFINELASLVSTCPTKSHKQDKLSILRMTVQHMKTLRGSAANCYTEVNHKAALLSDEELKHLIQKEADSFLFVMDCDGGKILFVSESVHRILNYTPNDLIGQSLFDYLHPKDIAKVKEQLCGPSVKTDNNPSSLRLCSGMRRSFFCRMKCNPKLEDEYFSFSYSKKNADHKGFCMVHSTGYLKNNEPGNDGCNSSCLVAVGRLYPHTVSQPVQNHIKVKPMEFVSRYDIDGKFVFVDQRATVILAYLPEELLGSSFYEYIHEDDIAHLAKCHKQVLQLREKINTNCYKMNIKGGSFITLRSRWFSFMNPWTKEVEYIVSTNTVVIPSGDRSESTYHLLAASPHTMATGLTPGEQKPGFQTVLGMPGENLVRRRVENLAREKERGKQAQDYSTTQEVPTSAQAEQDVSEALEAGQEVYDEDKLSKVKP